MLGSLLCFCRCLFLIIQPLVFHVRLHRPPQRPNVPLTETCSSPSLYQLQEEGVLCKDGLCKHLEKVPGKRPGRDTFFIGKMSPQRESFNRKCFTLHRGLKRDPIFSLIVYNQSHLFFSSSHADGDKGSWCRSVSRRMPCRASIWGLCPASFISCRFPTCRKTQAVANIFDTAYCC